MTGGALAGGVGRRSATAPIASGSRAASGCTWACPGAISTRRPCGRRMRCRRWARAARRRWPRRWPARPWRRCCSGRGRRPCAPASTRGSWPTGTCRPAIRTSFLDTLAEQERGYQPSEAYRRKRAELEAVEAELVTRETASLMRTAQRIRALFDAVGTIGLRVDQGQGRLVIHAAEVAGPGGLPVALGLIPRRADRDGRGRSGRGGGVCAAPRADLGAHGRAGGDPARGGPPPTRARGRARIEPRARDRIEPRARPAVSAQAVTWARISSGTSGMGAGARGDEGAVAIGRQRWRGWPRGHGRGGGSGPR